MKNNKPNIIFWVIDQFRLDRLKNYPLFDKLQREGIFFSEMTTYAPYTLASLHAMLSGMYGIENGVDAYYSALRFDKEHCCTLTKYLKENGYYTYADTFNKLFVPPQAFDVLDFYDEYTLGNEGILERHKKILNKLYDRDDNFFLFMHHSYNHAMVVQNVIKVFSDFDERYFGHKEKNAKRYDSYVDETVHYMEEVKKEIERLDQNKNTFLIICTDHGGGIGEKPGEKAYGIYVYDYTLKVWCYMVYPNVLPSGVRVDSLVRNIDIMPTVLDIVGITQKDNCKKIYGQSMSPLITGEKKEDRICFSETSPLTGPQPSPDKPSIKCVRTKEWKLIYNLIDKKKELYNLINDPEEINNLTGQQPEIEQQLWGELKKYL